MPLSVVQRCACACTCVCVCVLLLFVPSAAECLVPEDQAASDEETCLLQAGVHLLEPAAEEGRTPLNLIAGQKGQATSNIGEPFTFRSLWIYLACLAAYFIVALVYELRCSGEGDEESKRVLEWDAVRLVVQMSIVSGHLYYYALVNLQWGEEKPFLPEDVSHNEARDLQAEYFLYVIPSIYRMPIFCFISGVFGQKVDSTTLSRVVCYTYGTIVVERTFLTITGLYGGQLWYLKCLFFWRYTLSPLFNMVQDSSMKMKLALFALVSCLFFVMYDLTSAKLFPFNEACQYLPTYEFFALGPFFALGLLIPHKAWSALLTDRNVQIIGVAVAALGHGSMLYAPHYEWVNNVNPVVHTGTKEYGVQHWPVAPIPGQAFSPSHMLQHGLWFAYRTTFMFGVIMTVAAFTRVWGWVTPMIASKVLAGGSRSLYSYVIHQSLVAQALLRGAHYAVNGISTFNWFLLNFSVSVLVVLMCTSRLTERIFHPIIMPLWLLEIPAWLGLVTPDKPARGKPLCDALPAKNDLGLAGA